MDIHIIPSSEKDLHYKDMNCPCDPNLRVDGEEGEPYWHHNLLQPGRLFKGIFKL